MPHVTGIFTQLFGGNATDVPLTRTFWRSVPPVPRGIYAPGSVMLGSAKTKRAPQAD